MAFNTAPAVNTAPRGNAPAGGNQRPNWNATGFLNFYIPSRNGAKRKLGAIPLRDSNANEAQLIAWLQADPANMAKLMAKLQVEYRSAEADPGSAFDLDDEPAGTEGAATTAPAGTKAKAAATKGK